MQVEISGWPRVPGTTGAEKWSVSIDRKLLATTLREAAGRADEEHPAVLASFTQPVEHCDAIQAFTGARAAELGECFFWEQPAEQNALVGVGAETIVETGGSAYFSDASSARRALMNDSVITYVPETISTPAS